MSGYSEFDCFGKRQGAARRWLTTCLVLALDVLLVVAFGAVTAPLTMSIAHAQSGTSLPACPDPLVCFMSKQGKAVWAKENYCTFCAVSMTDLGSALTGADNGKLQDIMNGLNGHLQEYGLDSPVRLSQFFAQVSAETGSGATSEENLNYTALQINATKFKSHYFRSNPKEACEFGKVRDAKNIAYCKKIAPEYATPHSADKEAIANRAYADVNGNQGGVESGDGWKYRGRGMFQTTGRGNYKNSQDSYNKDFALTPADRVDFIAHPELLVQTDYALKSAVSYWLGNKLEVTADGTSDAHPCAASNAISKKVSGSHDHDADRCKRFQDITKSGAFRLVDCSLPTIVPPPIPPPFPLPPGQPGPPYGSGLPQH